MVGHEQVEQIPCQIPSCNWILEFERNATAIPLLEKKPFFRIMTDKTVSTATIRFCPYCGKDLCMLALAWEVAPDLVLEAANED